MVDSVTRPQRIAIITPAARGSSSGNRVTALRWAGLLRQLGHCVTIATEWRNQAADVLITVHAVKSADSVLAASCDRPNIRIITLLAGTDIYPSFEPDETTTAALARANALIALQPRALNLLPEQLRKKSYTLVQSATAVTSPRYQQFTAAVIAHLRPIKQPHIAIQAAAMLAPKIDIQLILAGSQLDDDYGQSIKASVANTKRTKWVGALPRRETKELLASSHACILPSQVEGGANVISEAIAAGTPILCSAISGNLGLLGDDWPGMFPMGDAAALAKLLERMVTEKSFFDELCQRTQQLQAMVDPAIERQAWGEILQKISGVSPNA